MTLFVVDKKVNVVEFPSIDSFDVATNISCRNVGLQRGQRKVCTKFVN